MNPGVRFLLAARRCEIDELEQLARTSELVDLVSRFTHALQRERGLSSLLLASQGRRHGAQRLHQVRECTAIEQQARATFDALLADPGQARNGARLFSRIAWVLQSLGDLPRLRERVAALEIGPGEATEHLARLIGGLLAVVFEAADSATDPQVSRALVALFNFMQGKELAGQERAIGSAVFASGRVDAHAQHAWRHLVEQQHASFDVFAAFAAPKVLAIEHASQQAEVLQRLDGLREMAAQALPRGDLPTSLAQDWYDCCTLRIDAMRGVEEVLAGELRRLCRERIAQAREELRDQQALLGAPAQDCTVSAAAATAPAHYGPHLERSILEMVQEQSLRLQAMADELATVRAALNERKLVERAKGLLMVHRAMSEPEAYKALRTMAMNQNRRLVDVAEAVLSMADVLAHDASAPPRR